MRLLQVPSEVFGLIAFTCQYVAGIVVFSIVRPWQSIASPLELIAVGIVISAANSVVIVEGGKMLAESFLRKREERGKEQGREQAFKEALNAFEDYIESLKKRGIVNLPPPPSVLFEAKHNKTN